jgi:hypothetical protein
MDAFARECCTFSSESIVNEKEVPFKHSKSVVVISSGSMACLMKAQATFLFSCCHLQWCAKRVSHSHGAHAQAADARIQSSISGWATVLATFLIRWPKSSREKETPSREKGIQAEPHPPRRQNHPLGWLAGGTEEVASVIYKQSLLASSLKAI